MALSHAYADVLSYQERRILLEASQELIDTTLMDLGASNRSDWTADNWLIGTMLPPRYRLPRYRLPRYRLRYTAEFARRFFVCLVTVIWRHGEQEPIRLSYVAEELVAHVLLPEAESLAEEDDQAADYSTLRDTLFEEVDFEFLYDETYDGIESTELGETMGIARLPFTE